MCSNAHLYISLTDHWLGPDRIHVVQNYRRGDWTADSAVTSFVMGPDADLPREGANASTHLDWAVLTLETPLDGAIAPVPEGATMPGGGDVLMQAGFSQDSRHVLTLHRHCAILAAYDGARVLTHDCDAVSGDSGSPLMILREDGSIDLLAIHSATGVDGGLTVGIAVSAAAMGDNVR